MTSCETSDHGRHTRRGIHFHSFKRRITTMSLYYQNMFRSGHGSHVLVSHLPLGSFPSARNKAQIWWVPAMAIHSTLSSSPPTHENKTQKKPHRINMGAGTGVSALGHLPVSLSIIQQLLWYLSFVVELCSWGVFGTTVCSNTRTKCVFFKVKVRNRFFFFQAAKLFLQTPPLPICWLLSVRTESKYGAVQV